MLLQNPLRLTIVSQMSILMFDADDKEAENEEAESGEEKEDDGVGDKNSGKEKVTVSASDTKGTGASKKTKQGSKKSKGGKKG